MSRIKNVVSVCALKDVKTWFYASRSIVKYIDSENYYVIVPQADYEVFQLLSPKPYVVIKEDELTPLFNLKYVEDRLPEGIKAIAPWYYQQFLKIQGLVGLPAHPDDLCLIWDADTIPVTHMDFIDTTGKLTYFKGNEYHKPYFVTISNLLGLEKAVNYSFVTQCLPTYRKWVTTFIQEIETRHNQTWIDAILGSIDHTGPGGCFAEYETLGTYIFATYPNEVIAVDTAWQRFGNTVYNSVDDFFKLEHKKSDDAFVAFEGWDIYTEETNPYLIKKPDNRLITRLVNGVKRRLIGSKD